MYHYDDTSLIRASEAERRHFLCSVTPVDVNKILAPAGRFQIRSRIALMHVDEHTSLVKNAVEEAEKLASKNESIQTVLGPIKALMNAKPTILKVKELSLNDFVANQIQAVAGGLGYEVETDNSRLFKSDPKKFNLSRFHTSRSDLFIYNHNCQDCYVVDDKAKLVVGTSENGDTGEQDPIPQLLGNMEKVAGNVAYHWLMYGKSGARKAFKYIIVYGLTLDYEKTTAYTYKLTMDFKIRGSTFLYGERPLHLENGLESFFRDNISLQKAFEVGRIATGRRSQEFINEKLPILNKILTERVARAPAIFNTSGLPDMPLHQFSENEWTARLFGCLQESQLDCKFKYTAEDCIFSTFPKTQRVATSINDPVLCYPFIGAQISLLVHKTVS